MLFELFIVSFFLFSSTYALYFAYLRRMSLKPWGLKIDKDFRPSVSIFVPAHNEETNIERKLENLTSISYPNDKIEVLVIDDASEDSTSDKVENFLKRHPEWNIRLVKQNPRAGKSAGLNLALSFSTNPIIIVSDADTFWPQNVLEVAMPYLMDPEIGALSGMGINENTGHSWVTKSEDTYLNLTNVIRVGESKLYSTIRFEGGFCAFKRSAFTRFDCESGSDDSGTALEVIQNNYRTIMVPEVVFYTSFPTNLEGKLKIKVRRANQLISLWLKCLKFVSKHRLILPKRIIIPEILLFLINPAIFLLLVVTAVSYMLLFPLSVFSLFILVSVVGLLLFARNLFLEVVVDNLLLFYASVGYLFGRRYVSWKKTETSN